jgi:hypothetical protein
MTIKGLIESLNSNNSVEVETASGRIKATGIVGCLSGFLFALAAGLRRRDATPSVEQPKLIAVPTDRH